MEVKVSLVEDNSALAAELENWLTASRRLKCLAVYPSAEAALKAIPSLPPDVLLVDLRLPGMSGVELIQKLRAHCPQVQCLVLTMYAESDLIFEALKAGACGYLLKRTKPSEIVDAVCEVKAGGSVMTPRIARRVLDFFTKSQAAKSPATRSLEPEDTRLTEREKQVLTSMMDGLARKQLVDALQINPHTLDYVIRCIYRKLHVNSAAAAISTAMREGILKSRK
jgi:DNA-binding NarL/FixJ family response regulator